MSSHKRKYSVDTLSAPVPKLQAQESILGMPGREGSPIPSPHTHSGRAIGVFTSGGDCSGMNAAVRAIVRMGIYLGCKVYLIKEGYQGMVDGGSSIEEGTWASVSGIVEKGGTVIGTARCADFRLREGRLRAAKHLIERGISNLICIGGDGSLTGADLFSQEWNGLLDDLVRSGEISRKQRLLSKHLSVVGILGSIDNDFCGTDMTVGTDSALHRIIEAVDAITTTAASDQKCFVLEIMGRHCGYLALVAAMACEADFVFIPEYPHQDGWQDKLCNKLTTERHSGQRVNMIFVAEGAIDLQGHPISANSIVQLIRERLGFEIRATVLGHVQRGGRPSAFDRILATRMGAEAVFAVLDAKADSPAVIISLDGNQMIRKQLVQCVERTKLVSSAMKELRFDDCVHARGRSFEANLTMYKLLSRLTPPKTGCIDGKCPDLRFAVLAVGAPACGANAAIRSFVRMSLVEGYEVYGVHDSLEGLAKGNVKTLSWSDVYGWAAQAGSMLGTRRNLPDEVGLDKLASALVSFKISGLLIVGGFEAYQTVLRLTEARQEFDAFKIPMIVIPSTISNNVPGTDFSLGSDTSLNEIVSICDRLKLSALGSMRRVFLVETMGGYCGYLATLAGLAGGADAAYINEEAFSATDIMMDCEHMRRKMVKSEIKRGLILINEKANTHYTTDFVYHLFSEHGKDFFTTRMNILGHMQQGGSASPFDRLMGTKLGTRAAQFMIESCNESRSDDGQVLTSDDKTAVLVGVVKRQTTFTPVTELATNTVFEKRLPSDQWWLKLRPLLRILAKHDDDYYTEAEDDSVVSSRSSSCLNLRLLNQK